MHENNNTSLVLKTLKALTRNPCSKEVHISTIQFSYLCCEKAIQKEVVFYLYKFFLIHHFYLRRSENKVSVWELWDFLCNCLLFSAENFHQNQKQNFTFLHLFLPLLNFLFPNFVLKTTNIPIYFWFKKIWHTQCTLIPYESWTQLSSFKVGKV